MICRLPLRTLLSLSLIGTLALADTAAAQPVAIDIGTLGGTWSFPTGLTDNGHVVGFSSTSENLIRGFVWTPATGMVDLGALGGDGSSAAYGVNNLGEVVGYSSAPPLRPFLGWSAHAFLWTEADGMIDLHENLASNGITCFRSWAIAVNDLGQVMIACEKSFGVSSPFLWTRTDGITDLGTHPDAIDMTAIALNDRGDVVARGRVRTYAGSEPLVDSHAFLWTAAEGWQDLGTLGGSRSWPSDFSQLTGGGPGSNALSNNGDAVGYSITPAGDRHAFKWSPTDLMIDLGTLGGSRSDAYAVNDNGWVVGGSYSDPVLQQRAEGYHPFVWTPTNGMVDLGTLGGSNAWATDVNNQGVVVGQTSTTGNAAIRGFMWTSDQGMLELPPLDGFSQSVPMIANNAGQVIGISFNYDTPPNENRHATLWLLPAPRDLISPTLLLPDAVAVEATSPDGAQVTFAVSATDDSDENVDVVCTPESGSFFPLGATLVTCTASDEAGNSASGSFEILVKDAAQQVGGAIPLIEGWNLRRTGTGGSWSVVRGSRVVTTGKNSSAAPARAPRRFDVDAHQARTTNHERRTANHEPRSTFQRRASRPRK